MVSLLGSQQKEYTTMASLQYSQMAPILLLLLVAALASDRLALAAPGEQPATMGRPGCRDKCGGMSIPFPFGMDKPGCFLPGFEVTCNASFAPPRAFLAHNGELTPPYEVIYQSTLGTETAYHREERYQAVELLDISLETNEVRVYGGVTSRCFTNLTAGFDKGKYIRLDSDGPFLLSPRDELVGVGWKVTSSMSYQIKPYPHLLSCTSDSPFHLTGWDGSCVGGLGCCRAALPPPWPTMPVIETGVILDAGASDFWETNPCSYGMVAESSWYNFTSGDLDGYEVLSKKLSRGVPLVLDFAIRSGPCQRDGCPSGNSFCANADYGAAGYVCRCRKNYHGNPYIANGCQRR